MRDPSFDLTSKTSLRLYWLYRTPMPAGQKEKPQAEPGQWRFVHFSFSKPGFDKDFETDIETILRAVCSRPRWLSSSFDKSLGSSLRAAGGGFFAFLGLVFVFDRWG